MVSVEQWAEIRRLHAIEGLAIRAIARRLGLHRATVRRALRATQPPRYRRPARASKLDPHRARIIALVKADPTIPAVVVADKIAGDGYAGGQTIVNAYLREIRPLFARPRTFGRTTYHPGEICQFDLWQPSRPIPVGAGQRRAGYVVVACLGYSRVGAGALVFSRAAPDILWGIGRCLWQLGGLPKTLVWDREGALHAGEGRPTDVYAAFLGQLRIGGHFCAPHDPQAKGLVERLQGYIETNFEPGRAFANEIDFADQLDRWFVRANARTHRTLRCRPVDRLADDRAAMAPLPGAGPPDVDRRAVIRVGADPYARIDTCDYSLDPRVVGRRVELRAGQRQITATCLDSGQIAACHRRSYARHRTIADPAHLAQLAAGRRPAEPAVEQRPLARYDALIPA